MTPQLQQAIRLLQLSALDLEQEILEALETNPLLEVDDEAPTAADEGLEQAQAEPQAEASADAEPGASDDAEFDVSSDAPMGEAGDDFGAGDATQAPLNGEQMVTEGESPAEHEVSDQMASSDNCFGGGIEP